MSARSRHPSIGARIRGIRCPAAPHCPTLPPATASTPAPRLDGLTPLYVAERDGDADEAAAALRAAGGEYTPDGDLACFPSYTRGKLPPRDPPKCGSEAAQEQHDLVYLRYGTRESRIWVFNEGADPVPGSFTVPGAKERLVFEPLGPTVYDALGLTNHHMDVPEMVSLVDRNGVSRIVMVRDSSMQFRHLCRDPITGTDTAVFEKSYMGSCCPWDDTVYMHYDADAGSLTQAFVDRTAEPDELLDANGACRWRAKREARSTYEETISALRVGELADLKESDFRDGEAISLPTRVVPAETVASVLATLDGLPHDIAIITRNEAPDSRRWKTVTVSGGRSRGYTWGGVALVWDDDRKEWRVVLRPVPYRDQGLRRRQARGGGDRQRMRGVLSSGPTLLLRDGSRHVRRAAHQLPDRARAAGFRQLSDHCRWSPIPVAQPRPGLRACVPAGVLVPGSHRLVPSGGGLSGILVAVPGLVRVEP